MHRLSITFDMYLGADQSAEGELLGMLYRQHHTLVTRWSLGISPLSAYMNKMMVSQCGGKSGLRQLTITTLCYPYAKTYRATTRRLDCGDTA